MEFTLEQVGGMNRDANKYIYFQGMVDAWKKAVDSKKIIWMMSRWVVWENFADVKWAESQWKDMARPAEVRDGAFWAEGKVSTNDLRNK